MSKILDMASCFIAVYGCLHFKTGANTIKEQKVNSTKKHGEKEGLCGLLDDLGKDPEGLGLRRRLPHRTEQRRDPESSGERVRVPKL